MGRRHPTSLRTEEKRQTTEKRETSEKLKIKWMKAWSENHSVLCTIHKQTHRLNAAPLTENRSMSTNLFVRTNLLKCPLRSFENIIAVCTSECSCVCVRAISQLGFLPTYTKTPNRVSQIIEYHHILSPCSFRAKIPFDKYFHCVRSVFVFSEMEFIVPGGICCGFVIL